MIEEQEVGLPTTKLSRKHGLCPASFYKMKARYSGMDLSDAKRLKQLDEENTKLRRLVADITWDIVVLKEFMRKYRRHKSTA